MTDNVTMDSYQPNYDAMCEVCGQVPTVTAVLDGQIVHDFGLCGVCCFGEAACLDPKEWNK